MESLEVLRRELAEARKRSDELFTVISPEALYSRPIAERNRLIFYLGHFEAFDWAVLALRGKGERGFHPEFDKLFERGIDPPPGQAPADTPADWPSRDEVLGYGAKTREWVDTHLGELDPLLLNMVIEHRYMHVETFCYLMHNLPYADKQGPSEKPVTRPVPPNAMLPMGGGKVTLGKAPEGFGWDNEYPAHDIAIPPFAASTYKVSNGEYLEFVRAGGPAPHFWVERKGSLLYRGMFDEVPLPLDWPAWVTWQQADAFAKWKNASLPTEAQFQLGAALTPPDPARDNFGFVQWDPMPVDSHNGSWVGNGWEWTRDIFAPFEGFEPSPFYPAYSADFFDGAHYVMKGASPRTAAALTRPSFRNWFRPDYPYMYAGFRLVENR